MCEYDLVAILEYQWPKQGHLLPLTYRVRGHERSYCRGKATIVHRLHEPSRHIIKRLPPFDAITENSFEILFLLTRLPLRSQVWRIATNVGLSTIVIKNH